MEEKIYPISVALTSPIDVVLGRVTVPVKLGPSRFALRPKAV